MADKKAKDESAINYAGILSKHILRLSSDDASGNAYIYVDGLITGILAAAPAGNIKSDGSVNFTANQTWDNGGGDTVQIDTSGIQVDAGGATSYMNRGKNGFETTAGTSTSGIYADGTCNFIQGSVSKLNLDNSGVLNLPSGKIDATTWYTDLITEFTGSAGIRLKNKVSIGDNSPATIFQIDDAGTNYMNIDSSNFKYSIGNLVGNSFLNIDETTQIATISVSGMTTVMDKNLGHFVFNGGAYAIGSDIGQDHIATVLVSLPSTFETWTFKGGILTNIT